MTVYRIEEYIPDSLYEQYETLRDLALDWFIRIGLIGKGDKARPTSDSPRK
jgi:protein kinase C substrate 80K-H